MSEDGGDFYRYPPGPDDIFGGVMRNISGIRDAEQFREHQYKQTGRREAELRADPQLVKQTWDADHLRAIHRYLFQDVYTWAGDYRTVEIQKGGHEFSPVVDIDTYLGFAADAIARTDWPRVNRDEFAAAVADVYALLNEAHPFREGNGRTAKVLLSQVAEQSPWRLDYSRISPQEWNLASARSTSPDGEAMPDPRPLVAMMAQATVDAGDVARADPDISVGIRSIRPGQLQPTEAEYRAAEAASTPTDVEPPPVGNRHAPGPEKAPGPEIG